MDVIKYSNWLNNQLRDVKIKATKFSNYKNQIILLIQKFVYCNMADFTDAFK